ncbi:conserved protein of unknown function [Acidithiobacillus ferrivorans]|uniref:Uncharacterized protein n=1 Tax=Acidithiobacillus ferrivorans TaxID=160808 RepID=A0A060UZP2_9PROT|nr:hypothetical protein [Acidithiobacillus ferrivorans]CDQ12118.1 conserved hypothetical protein [Acidithiobacillus ferrivorans]SMH64755.1 conserved protein of unknown function [Acidithiobacillus ferrivorans]
MSSHQIIKKGPVIGQYENRPIYEYLVYSDGRVIEFAHVVRAERDGQFMLSKLANDECLVSHGLVYRRDGCAEPGCLTEH